MVIGLGHSGLAGRDARARSGYRNGIIILSLHPLHSLLTKGQEVQGWQEEEEGQEMQESAQYVKAMLQWPWFA